MAQTTKKPSKATTAKQASAQADQATYEETKIHGYTPDELAEQQDRRIKESQGFFNGEGFKLDKVRKENRKLYYGQQVSDDDDGEDENLALDNRIFSSIRYYCAVCYDSHYRAGSLPVQ
jgi:hypothetical protein